MLRFFEIGFSTIRFFEWKGFDEVIFSESVFHYFELRGSPFEFKCLKLRVKIRGQCYKIRTRLQGLIWGKSQGPHQEQERKIYHLIFSVMFV